MSSALSEEPNEYKTGGYDNNTGLEFNIVNHKTSLLLMVLNVISKVSFDS